MSARAPGGLARLWDRAGEAFDGLSPRDQRALKVGGVVLGGVALWLGVVSPLLGLSEALQDRIESEASLLVRERGVLAEAPALPERADALRVELERWDARMIRSPNLALAEAETTALLQALARENLVLLEEARAVSRPPGSLPPPGLTPIRLSLRGESDFEGVLGFLAALEADPLLIRIEALSIQQPAGGSAGGGGGGASGAAGAARNGAREGVVVFMAVVETFAPAEG
jgi:hypothetical protein